VGRKRSDDPFGLRDLGGGRWQITVDVPRERGEPRHQRSRRVHDCTRAQARRAAFAFRQEVLAEGRVERQAPQTVAQFVATWLSTVVERDRRPGTLHGYRGCLARLLPHIGHLRLDRLRPLDIEQAYAALRPSYSSSTLRTTHMVLGTALRCAVRWGLIKQSPLDGVSAPSKDTREMQALSREEAIRFLAAAREHPQGTRLILALGLGMRAGEVVALQWRDIDLEALARSQPCTLTIRRSYCPTARQYGPTKTGRVRTVAVPEFVADQLRAELARQAARRDRDPEWNPDGLVAVVRTGNPAPSYLSRVTKSLCASLGLPPVRFHDLRHSLASLRLQDGENPKLVAAELGHEPAMLLKVYAHVVGRAAAEGAERVDRLLRPQKSAS
jgi:integrase